MFKATPPVNISSFNKASATAAEAVTSSSFVSIQTSYNKAGTDGTATRTTAAIPAWAQYDRGRVLFGDVAYSATGTGATTAAVVELLGRSKEGINYKLGTSTMTGTGSGVTFPVIEFDLSYEKYFVRLLSVGAGNQIITLKPLFQAYYRAADATG